MKPQVSIIIPCRNEAKTITYLLQALYGQSFPLEAMQVVIADGFSEDSTREQISLFAQNHSELQIKVVDNPKKIIPSGLNRAIEASEGEFIVRLDAHSIPSADYVQRSVSALKENVAENVGGVWDIRPQNNSATARAIAAAAGHPLAVGGAKYRYSQHPEYVETVPFGAWKRSTLLNLCGFDETLLTNEDYELNTRLSAQGGRIYLDPQIRSVYFSRPDFKSLAQQYWRYGFWKAQMLKRYPGSLKLRQALPPIMVAGFAFLLLLSSMFAPLRPVFLAAVGFYLFILLAIGTQIAIKKKDIMMIPLVALAIAMMHVAWGSGFLLGSIKTP
ncbi:MAG: glycosyltransferase family 2 protein [Anaerolineaceae bacterium]|nr:glycosyltransferase family 2 protein [Anaerolineaceae bacterium]